MHFDKPTYSVRKSRKKEIPKGLYTKDPLTGEILFKLGGLQSQERRPNDFDREFG